MNTKRNGWFISLLIVLLLGLSAGGRPVLASLTHQTEETDGGAWHSYGQDLLPDVTVNAVAVGLDGALWASTREGVSYFDGAAWTTYTVDDGLVFNQVRAIAVAPDGTVWLGTWRGVSRFTNPAGSAGDGEAWTTYTVDDGLASNSIAAIAAAPNGVVWFGTKDSGVSKFDGESWTTYTTADGLTSNEVTSLAVGPDGVLYVRTLDAGASGFDGESWTIYAAADGLASKSVATLAVAPDGAIWFGTGHAGVSRFDGETWTTFDKSDGLVGTRSQSVAVAPNGVVWFGFEGGISGYFPPVTSPEMIMGEPEDGQVGESSAPSDEQANESRGAPAVQEKSPPWGLVVIGVVAVAVVVGGVLWWRKSEPND